MSLPKDYKVYTIEGELHEVQHKSVFDTPSVKIVIELDNNDNTFQLTNPEITTLIKNPETGEPGVITWIEIDPVCGVVMCAAENALIVEDALRKHSHVTAVGIGSEVYQPKTWMKAEATPETKTAVMNGFIQLATGQAHIIAVRFAGDLIEKYDNYPLLNLYPADAYIIPSAKASYEHPMYLSPWNTDTLRQITLTPACAGGIAVCNEFTALIYCADVHAWMVANHHSNFAMRVDIPVM